ncbi:UDP-glycosyltransferase 91C1-like [Mangifera indica]|uniref:UDP-glycosyltransferase 91C1-like n=1 Tax=Mangifera indica TaxID=29780 RepID=UPI001CFA663D|nr:UDP-glycosyltransferase 91C1-like [Mangifera indica]
MGDKEKLHIAMFPWLAYGHVMPFFQVAKFFAEKGHHVYFISTPKIIHRLPQSDSNLSSHLRFFQLPLPPVQGLPEGVESPAELPIQKDQYLKKAYDMLQLPLINFLKDNSQVTWIIQDFVSYWLPSAAAQLGVYSVYFSIVNATTCSFFGSAADLINGRFQKAEDLTMVPQWINYNSNIKFKLYEIMRGHQECKDSVPDLYRYGMVLKDCRAVIVRSCPEFEPEAFSIFGKLLEKPVLPVSLLPPSLQDYTVADGKWQVLKDWLDSKKDKSVVYVALGTLLTLSQELMHELAYGLEKSGLPFIWVINKRPLVEGKTGSDLVPVGFEDRISGRGLIWTDWAPQIKILAHASVGGFLTHSGWSSVIESLGFGLPLIMLTGGSDTGLVARLMHMRVGLEIERDERDGAFTSDSVAESIRRVIKEKEGHALRANAWAMREIFGNLELRSKYLEEMVRFIEKDPAPTRSV